MKCLRGAEFVHGQMKLKRSIPSLSSEVIFQAVTRHVYMRPRYSISILVDLLVSLRLLRVQMQCK